MLKSRQPLSTKLARLRTRLARAMTARGHLAYRKECWLKSNSLARSVSHRSRWFIRCSTGGSVAPAGTTTLGHLFECVSLCCAAAAACSVFSPVPSPAMAALAIACSLSHVSKLSLLCSSNAADAAAALAGERCERKCHRSCNVWPLGVGAVAHCSSR